MPTLPPSEEPAVLQIVFDDDVSDGIKDKLHVLGVGGTGEVCVDLLGVLPLVQVLELALDVAGGLVVLVGTWGGRDDAGDVPRPPRPQSLPQNCLTNLAKWSCRDTAHLNATSPSTTAGQTNHHAHKVHSAAPGLPLCHPHLSLHGFLSLLFFPSLLLYPHIALRACPGAAWASHKPQIMAAPDPAAPLLSKPSLVPTAPQTPKCNGQPSAPSCTTFKVQ